MWFIFFLTLSLKSFFFSHSLLFCLNQFFPYLFIIYILNNKHLVVCLFVCMPTNKRKRKKRKLSNKIIECLIEQSEKNRIKIDKACLVCMLHVICCLIPYIMYLDYFDLISDQSSHSFLHSH